VSRLLALLLLLPSLAFAQTSPDDYKPQPVTRVPNDLSVATAGPLVRQILIMMDRALIRHQRIIDGEFAGVFDHGDLAGLLDDDHTQYLLLAGRSSGQTASGAIEGEDDGTPAGRLQLQSHSGDDADARAWVTINSEDYPGMQGPDAPLVAFHSGKQPAGLQTLGGVRWLMSSTGTAAQGYSVQHNYEVDASMPYPNRFLLDNTNQTQDLTSVLFDVTRAASHTGDFVQYKSGSTVQTGIEADGDIYGGPAAATLALLSNNVNNSTTARISLLSTPSLVFDIPSGSVDPIQIGLGLVSGSFTGTSLDMRLLSTGGNPSSLEINNDGGSASSVPLVIEAHASQSANLTTWRNSSAATLSRIKSDGTFEGPISTTSAVGVVDTTFVISDDVTPTKTLKTRLTGATASTQTVLMANQTADRVVTLPNATTTLAGTNVAQTFTKQQTVQADTDVPSLTVHGWSGFASGNIFEVTDGFGNGLFVVNINAGAGGASVAMPGPLAVHDGPIGNPAAVFASTGLTADRTYTLPDASGVILTTTSTATVTNKTFGSGNSSTGTGWSMRSNTASSGAAFLDNATTTKALRFVLSGLTASTNNSITASATAARDWELKDAAGTIAIVGNEAAPPSTDNLGAVNATAQSDSIAATNLTSATAVVGMYVVDFELTCTTADGTAGTIGVDVIATGDMGALVTRIGTLSLAATGSTRGSVQRYVSSGALQFAVRDVSGNVNAAVFTLRLRATYLG
jgi:hypothetical protein